MKKAQSKVFSDKSPRQRNTPVGPPPNEPITPGSQREVCPSTQVKQLRRQARLLEEKIDELKKEVASLKETVLASQE